MTGVKSHLQQIGTKFIHVRAIGCKFTQVFSFHARLADDISPFFGFIEGSEEEQTASRRKTHDIECEPEAFEVFVNWLYGVPILQQDHMVGDFGHGWQDQVAKRMLVDCYKLGTTVECSRFQNVVIDALRETFENAGEVLPELGIEVFTTKPRETISCLQRFFAAFILYRIRKNQWQDNYAEQIFEEVNGSSAYIFDALREADQSGEINPSPAGFDSSHYTRCYFRKHNENEKECVTDTPYQYPLNKVTSTTLPESRVPKKRGFYAKPKVSSKSEERPIDIDSDAFCDA